MAKLVIFDVDGTLVDSETQCLIALTKVIPDLQMSLTDLSLHYRGCKLTWIFEDLAQRLGRTLPDDIVSDYRAAYVALCKGGLDPFPYVSTVLDQLTLPACVASNAPLAKIALNLDAAGLAQYFPAAKRFSAYEVNAWKPDPRLFLAAAEAHAVAPVDCIVVEDSAAGIEAAQAAGMRVIQFCEPGAQPIHDLWFSDYRALPDMIGAF